MNISYEELIEEAKKARRRAYVPYSGFGVGAALVAGDGKIYHGCNIENAAYGPTNCAERTAFFKAVYEGERSFLRIAIVGGKSEEDCNRPCAPCGVCRQVMMEFCDPKEFEIVLADQERGYRVYRLEEMLPLGFGPKNLEDSNA